MLWRYWRHVAMQAYHWLHLHFRWRYVLSLDARYAKCLHRPIVIINQQYTKGEIHFINRLWNFNITKLNYLQHVSHRMIDVYFQFSVWTLYFLRIIQVLRFRNSTTLFQRKHLMTSLTYFFRSLWSNRLWQTTSCRSWTGTPPRLTCPT